MKKILSIVLALIMVLTICPVMAFAEENTSGILDSGYCGADGDNLTWTFYKDGELVISGDGDMLNFNGVAPWREAYRNSVKTVVVEDGVTSIGDYAFTSFYYTTDFRIADSVTSIGEYSFGWTSFGNSANNGLHEVKLPATVTDISNKAFYSSNIDRIVVPENITIIKDSTFSNCDKLDTVIIPVGVTSIEDNAFAGCVEIDTVYFRGTEEQWNNITFGTGNGYLKTAENIVFNAICHDYKTYIVNPTCAEKGYTEYVCKICGYTYTDNYVDVIDEHDIDEPCIIEPTCTEKGYTLYYCCECDYSYKDDFVDMKGHTTTNGQCKNCKAFIVEVGATMELSTTVVNAKNPVWSADNDCIEIVSSDSQISIMIGTSYVETVESVEIKGIKEGSTYLKLYTNGYLKASSEIIVVPHQTHVAFETINGISATCTESGLTYGTNCAYCGEVVIAQEEIPALGHTEEVIPAKSATCTETGLTEGKKCSVCDEILVEQIEIPSTGHDYSTVVTAPTCTEKGYTTYICDCGVTFIDDYVNATGHDYSTVVTAPTCTERGYTTYTCDCGVNFIDDYVNATGHDYSTVVTAPTCTEKGYTTYTCDCGVTFIDDYVNATGHDYSTVVTSPTCTEKGYTTYTCDCGFSDKLDYVNAKGHTAGAWVVKTPAQVGKKGREQQKCTVCGVVLNERDILALPEQTTKPIEKPTNKVGDANGDGKITAADARIVLRISAKLEKIENYNIPLTALDVTGDGKLTAADARKVLRISAKLE